MQFSTRVFGIGLILTCCAGAPQTLHAADAPSIELALSFKPAQKDVDYEIPQRSEYDDCTIKVERSKAASGWVVYGPQGQVLRRFIDTNRNNVVDQWRYYQHGLEVYRDTDTNHNNKVDQSRWYNTGGTRHGIDSDEDGVIDTWKRISPEEASRVAVHALVAGDEQALQSVLIDAKDVRALGISAELSKQLLDSVNDADKKMRKLLAGSKGINDKTTWMRFDGSMPGTIPAESGKAKSDVTVYENAMAIVETAGEPVLVQIGELVLVGDAWKLTQIPSVLDGSSVQVTAGGILMQPTLEAVAGAAPTVAGLSPESQKLVQQLQELDRNSPAPTAGNEQALATYNKNRAELLGKLIETSRSDEEREQWTRQMADSIAAAVQTGTDPKGLERLQSIEQAVEKRNADSDVLPYVTYRRLLAEYSDKIRSATNENAGEIQEWWLKQLEAFADKYPKAEDTPEVLFQLGSSQEFAGNVEVARKWYNRLVSQHGSQTGGLRAAGALRRIDMKGKPFTFSGAGLKGGTITDRDFRGKVLLVLFWSTWCVPCGEDLPVIQAVYKEYHSRGFEVLGINLDATAAPVGPYLAQNNVTWPQSHEEGGLDASKPALTFGIISLPTMFLVDADGKVVNNAVTADELKTLVPELLKK